ncbi:hypothetical protein M6B38_380360 [Iris pallida]|uniref:Uncharacterized protein n=1 Tax=Iris pallida TaxID=29817 RepID=A0AAX6G7Y9_IRIPA|nr:hypothetical protein M6B38_380360 [Iris pallida]
MVIQKVVYYCLQQRFIKIVKLINFDNVYLKLSKLLFLTMSLKYCKNDMFNNVFQLL